MDYEMPYRSKEAAENMRHAQALMRELLNGVPNYSSEKADAILELIFLSSVLESNANLKFVFSK